MPGAMAAALCWYLTGPDSNSLSRTHHLEFACERTSSGQTCESLEAVQLFRSPSAYCLIETELTGSMHLFSQ